MDSRDLIFFPCWDKSKPALMKLRELHRKNKGGETAAAADERKDGPPGRLTPGRGTSSPPAQGGRALEQPPKGVWEPRKFGQKQQA